MGFHVKCMYLDEFTYTKGDLDDRLKAIAAHPKARAVAFP
jgi:hypothetical protein